MYAFSGDCIDFNSGRPLGIVSAWPGPAFVINQYGQVEITFINNLTGKHMFTIEKNLDYMYDGPIDFDNFIPLAVHIHGMANPPKYDGPPEAWYTKFGLHGKDYATFSNP